AAYDQRSLVQERSDLLSVRRNLHGCRWRWDRRFSGTNAPPRLSEWTGRDRDLADAVSDVALPRRWLRRRRLITMSIRATVRSAISSSLPTAPQYAAFES